eukprot:639269-Prorocentrum_minimum.AAC.1
MRGRRAREGGSAWRGRAGPRATCAQWAPRTTRTASAPPVVAKEERTKDTTQRNEGTTQRKGRENGSPTEVVRSAEGSEARTAARRRSATDASDASDASDPAAPTRPRRCTPDGRRAVPSPKRRRRFRPRVREFTPRVREFTPR